MAAKIKTEMASTPAAAREAPGSLNPIAASGPKTSLNPIGKSLNAPKSSGQTGSLNPIKGSVNQLSPQPRATAAGSAKKSGGAGGKPASTSPAQRPVAASAGGRISRAPAFIAPLAKKMNQIAAKVAAMQGVPPIRVMDAAGNQLVSLDLATLISLLLADSTFTDAVVPTELHFDYGTTQVDIDDNGIVATSDSGAVMPLNKNNDGAMSVVLGSYLANINHHTFVLDSTTYRIEATVDGGLITFTRKSNGKTITIDLSILARDIAIRTIDVCDSGSPASMDILGSAPY